MNKLTKRDFESEFCLECVDYGEPNGCNRSTGGCEAYAFCQEAWDELNEYRKLEEQGMLVRLPCKVGDVIFVIPSKANYELNVLSGYFENNRVYIQTVQEIRFFKNNKYLLTTCDGCCSVHSDFYNINWFLTKSEAQKALEEGVK